MNIVLLIFLGAVAATGFATAGVWLGHRFLRGRIAEGHHEVLLALFQTGGTLHAVFLAFLVVAVWQSYDTARGNVAEEASALATLYRTSAGMEVNTGGELRKLLRQYVQAVIEDEWAVQAKSGSASPRARAAGLAMYRLFGREGLASKQNDSAINAAALEIIAQIQSDRNKRTLQSEDSLPAIIWFAAIGSGTIVLAMSFFLISEQVARQMILTSIIASTIALLLCTTFALSRPFFGPLALQPEPFKHSLQVFDAVDAALGTMGSRLVRKSLYAAAFAR
ncbi:MAG: DUF4239 domain-containing protein [Acetobacteraceae bacterium]|nr:DUF4239 domain-containing protein [Acetobacteraceae bacterium]